jgi:hypothetical protein
MNDITKSQNIDERDRLILRQSVFSVLLSSIDGLSSPLSQSIDGGYHSLLI